MEILRKAYWLAFVLAYLSLCACALIFIIIAFVPLAWLEHRRAATAHKQACLRIYLASPDEPRSWHPESVPAAIESVP
jgi:hypothetical protein